jgi:hypothetical protein
MESDCLSGFGIVSCVQSEAEGTEVGNECDGWCLIGCPGLRELYGGDIS